MPKLQPDACPHGGIARSLTAAMESLDLRDEHAILSGSWCPRPVLLLLDAADPILARELLTTAPAFGFLYSRGSSALEHLRGANEFGRTA